MTPAKKRQLLQRRDRLCTELGSLTNLIRGSLVQGEKKCGRKGCRCETGELHPHVVISTHRDGKTQIVYVPKASRTQAAGAVEAYGRAWQLLEQLSSINTELLKAQEL